MLFPTSPGRTRPLQHLIFAHHIVGTITFASPNPLELRAFSGMGSFERLHSVCRVTTRSPWRGKKETRSGPIKQGNFNT